MKPCILELRTAFSPPYCKPEELKNRHTQFANGLKKFFEYKEKLNLNQCDCFLLDNTVKNLEEIPEEIKAIIKENNLEVFYSPHNKYGKHNKGAGDIEGLKFVKEKISNYQWFIHFEPRQLLVSHQFFDSFFNKPRDLFTFNDNPNARRHFNTGLYATETKNIIKFIDIFNDTELQKMVLNSVSIEYILHDYFINNKIHFSTLPKMDLLWFYDNENNYKHW